MRSLVIFTALAVTVCSAGISNNCMDCICEVEGCENNIGQCNWDVHSYSCGPFQIKEPYYIDCYEPGADWRTCTKQMACSQTCVQNYMDRYGTFCTGGRQPICEDYAKIHNAGPFGCQYDLDEFWGRVRACCDRTPGGCD